jgi:hypothetical protein
MKKVVNISFRLPTNRRRDNSTKWYVKTEPNFPTNNRLNCTNLRSCHMILLSPQRALLASVHVCEFQEPPMLMAGVLCNPEAHQIYFACLDSLRWP